MQNTAVLVFLAGCILIITGIIGGGIEVREIRIPQLPTIPRILSALFGAALVLFVIFDYSFFSTGVISLPGTATATQTGVPIPQNHSEPSSPPEFVTVINRLGGDQAFERVQIFISGQRTFDLVVDRDQTTNSVRIPVTGDSDAPYTLRGTAGMEATGTIETRYLEGSGLIDLSKKSSLSLHHDDRVLDDGNLHVKLVVEPETADGSQ